MPYWQRPEGTRSPALTTHVDVHATLLDCLGVSPPRPVDGVSLLPAIRGEREQVRYGVLFGWWGRRVNWTDGHRAWSSSNGSGYSVADEAPPGPRHGTHRCRVRDAVGHGIQAQGRSPAGYRSRTTVHVAASCPARSRARYTPLDSSRPCASRPSHGSRCTPADHDPAASTRSRCPFRP